MLDAFIFYNELDLLEYRLYLLNDYVDYFVIVEATHTFAGNSKELYYTNNKERFKEYSHKIIHIVVDDMPIKSKITVKKSVWENEYHQRNCIQRGLNELNLTNNDIVIISDVDEIPDPQVLKQINKYKVTINCLIMDLYWYNLNRKNINVPWRAARILRYGLLKGKTIQEIRQLDCSPLITHRSGWHLSYFGDADFIHNKLNNFAHQENEVQSINNITEIERRMGSGGDLYAFNRGWEFTFIHTDNNQYLPPGYKDYLSKFFINKKIHFITYGNFRFAESKKRLIKEAEDVGVFKTISGCGPENLPREFIEKYKTILSLPRGGGYWIWRPIILKNKLESMKDGEFLIYLDAGCTLNKVGIERFNEYIDILDKSDYGIISFQMSGVKGPGDLQYEKVWTNTQIFDYLGVPLDSEHANSGQYLGGILVMKKNAHLLKIIDLLIKAL